MKCAEPIWGVVTGFSDDLVYASMCVALGDERNVRFSKERWFSAGTFLQVGDTIIADISGGAARKATQEDFDKLEVRLEGR